MTAQEIVLFVFLSDPRILFPSEDVCEANYYKADKIVRQYEHVRDLGGGTVQWNTQDAYDRWKLVRAWWWAQWWVTWHQDIDQEQRWKWAHTAWQIQEQLADWPCRWP